MIDAAIAILQELGRPASAREIVTMGINHAKHSRSFSGRTPHKTLNARISVDIVRFGAKSAFYRFGPASYGLRSELGSESYDRNYKKLFFGKQRRKEVSNELVAVVSNEKLHFLSVDGLYDCLNYPLSIMNLLDVHYIDRKSAELRNDLRQLVSYACILHDGLVLTFEKGRYTSDNGEFIGNQSIGFGGHVNYDDLSLFDSTPVGFHSNLRRELHEELYIFERELRDTITDISFAGFLVDSSTDNGKRHLGLAACVQLSELIQLETPTLGIRNLRWQSYHSTPNSFHQYEIWSQYLFRHIQNLIER